LVFPEAEIVLASESSPHQIVSAVALPQAFSVAAGPEAVPEVALPQAFSVVALPQVVFAVAQLQVASVAVAPEAVSVDIAVASVVLALASVVVVEADSSGLPRFLAFPNAGHFASSSSSVGVGG